MDDIHSETKIYTLFLGRGLRNCVKFQGIKTHSRLSVTLTPVPEINADIYLSWWKKQLLYLVFHLRGTHNILCQFPSWKTAENWKAAHIGETRFSSRGSSNFPSVEATDKAHDLVLQTSHCTARQTKAYKRLEACNYLKWKSDKLLKVPADVSSNVGKAKNKGIKRKFNISFKNLVIFLPLICHLEVATTYKWRRKIFVFIPAAVSLLTFLKTSFFESHNSWRYLWPQ